MEIPATLERWLAQMQAIRQQMDCLLADTSLSAEVHEQITRMKYSTERFIEAAQEIIKNPARPAIDTGFLRTRSHLRRPLDTVTGASRRLMRGAYGELSHPQTKIVLSIRQGTNTIIHEMYWLMYAKYHPQ